MNWRHNAGRAFAVGLVMSTVCGAAPAGKLVTIDFDGLKGADGTPFATYSQHGFKVTARKTNQWLNGQNNGDPAPCIYFFTSSPPASASVYVTHGGAMFSFTSIALYSSITTIPYAFRGTRNGMTVFAVKGTVPNTFGAFATVANRRPNVMIDKLEVTLTDPPDGYDNPVGLDNIALLYQGQ
jgi:hypothetical protein